MLNGNLVNNNNNNNNINIINNDESPGNHFYISVVCILCAINCRSLSACYFCIFMWKK